MPQVIPKSTQEKKEAEFLRRVFESVTQILINPETHKVYNMIEEVPEAERKEIQLWVVWAYHEMKENCVDMTQAWDMWRNLTKATLGIECFTKPFYKVDYEGYTVGIDMKKAQAKWKTLYWGSNDGYITELAKHFGETLPAIGKNRVARQAQLDAVFNMSTEELAEKLQVKADEVPLYLESFKRDNEIALEDLETAEEAVRNTLRLWGVQSPRDCWRPQNAGKSVFDIQSIVRNDYSNVTEKTAKLNSILLDQSQQKKQAPATSVLDQLQSLNQSTANGS